MANSQDILSPMLRFLPPIALMGVIFLLSAEPNLSTGLGFWDLLLRKLAHIGAFGMLTLLWWRALVRHTGRALVYAVAIAFLYAITDEYHQSFVEGRNGSPVDVAIDSIGIAGAVLLIRRSGRRRDADRSGPR